jgi:hypothetical protein
MESPDFLKNKYDLHNAPEVEAAARRAETRGEKVPQDPEARIQNYLDRFKEIIERKNPEERERGIEALKKAMFNKFVTKIDEVSDNYLEKQLREKGMSGDYNQASAEQKEEFKRQNIEPVLRDQQASLEQWVDYFSSTDSAYVPDHLKYWVFREITGLQEYDKEKKKFPKRSTGTVNKFPDLNYEALGYVIDAVLKKYQDKSPEFEYDIQPEEKQRFEQYLQGENFSKLYAWSVELINPIPEHLLPITEGEWKKYIQKTNHRSLVDSIRGKGTGWCTAGENTAKTQLNNGDFFVFYSLDDEKKPTIPRIAIRMEGDKIGEIRGVAYKQNLDPFMGGVLEKKLNEKNNFSDKEHYLKKDRDMKFLTEIDNKIKKEEQLTKSDLLFLYEINQPIEGFGYQRDPRIAEIRKTRNPQEDASVVFECQPDQIAHNQNEITKNTKAYIGPLFQSVFQLNLENIGTSFPEGMVKKMEAEISGKDGNQLEKELKEKNINISDYASDMLKKITVSKKEHLNLVRLTVKDLGFPNGATTDEIYQRGKELGLELCPADTGPNLRLQNSTPDYMSIAMKQIAGRDGNPFVFNLHRYDDGLWLIDRYAKPSDWWDDFYEFVFRLRKLKLES